MAAMTGAEFRRRDACRARGPVVSTTGGASGSSVERSTGVGGGVTEGEKRAWGGGKLGGLAGVRLPRPTLGARSRNPYLLSLFLSPPRPPPQGRAAPTLTQRERIIIYFPFISFSELHSYSYRCPFSNSPTTIYPSTLLVLVFAVSPFVVLVFRRSIRAWCLASFGHFISRNGD